MRLRTGLMNERRRWFKLIRYSHLSAALLNSTLTHGEKRHQWQIIIESASPAILAALQSCRGLCSPDLFGRVLWRSARAWDAARLHAGLFSLLAAGAFPRL